MSKIAIVITAAGSSTRIGGEVKKEYLRYKDGTVLSNCATAFLNANYKDNEICTFIITCPKNGRDKCKAALQCDKAFIDNINKQNFLLNIVEGGDSRQASVYNALDFINEKHKETDYVLIHDGARPFISSKVIEDTVDATIKYGAAVPGFTPIDTQKEINEDGFIKTHLIRSNLRAVQTPQGFNFKELLNAHKKAMEVNREFTDDTEIFGEFTDISVKVIDGDVNNIKITYPKDLENL